MARVRTANECTLALSPTKVTTRWSRYRSKPWSGGASGRSPAFGRLVFANVITSILQDCVWPRRRFKTRPRPIAQGHSRSGRPSSDTAPQNASRPYKKAPKPLNCGCRRLSDQRQTHVKEPALVRESPWPWLFHFPQETAGPRRCLQPSKDAQGYHKQAGDILAGVGRQGVHHSPSQGGTTQNIYVRSLRPTRRFKINSLMRHTEADGKTKWGFASILPRRTPWPPVTACCGRMQIPAAPGTCPGRST